MKTITKTLYVLVLTVSLQTAFVTTAVGQDWPQWGRDPQHTGQINVAGQNLNQNIADVIYDPTVPDELSVANQIFGESDLLVHYQVPLIDGNDVYMEFKSGNANKNSFSTLNWAENKLTWQGSSLVQVWSFASDWKAPGSYFDFWQPVFHSVLANGALYVPGAGGTIFKVNKSTGAQIARINPFGTIDDNTYTAGPISADPSGNLYYNVVQLQPGGGSFYAKDSVDSWLVKVAPDNSTTKVSYFVLTPNAPGPDDRCEISFPQSQAPWPPSPTAVPPTVRCGPIRVALNIAPAIAPDGTIYSIARSHDAFANRSGFLVAVNPNLTSKWSASLSNRFNDGCGVPISAGGVLPPNGQPGGCRAGANLGVDPGLNHAGGGRVLDDSSASPVVAPDGSIFYGAYTRYNYAQGHLMQFSSSGQYLGAYRFGWDLTPGIKQHGGTYSVVIKDNQYAAGSYCDVEAVCPSDRTVANSAGYPEAYFITQLNHNLNVEWRFQNTNTFSCSRQPDGSVTCVNDHPNGFEWCVNAMVIDANGVVYANSEDGNLFALNPDGTLKQKIFQQLALGAAYTPASLGLDGKIYSQNAGHLFVVGN